MPLGLGAATNDLSGLLQKGLFEEEANRNLEAAAQAYSTVSAQFDKDRKLAATAIFRLGEIYRKQGKTNEAAGQYERIVREFADQDTLVTLSRQNLAGMGAKAEATVSSTLTRTARLEQTKLLEEEIKLVEQDLVELRRQIEVGRASPTDLRAKEREVLKLRQHVAALDVQVENVPGGTTSLKTATTDDEEKEIRRIQAMIQNSPDLINAPSGGGLTPLHTAASQGQLTVARFLLDNKANVNARNNNQETPLTLAALQGHKAMVELLLGRGADVNAKGGVGYTALHQTALKGFNAVAETLIANQAEIDARSNGGETPLHLAAAVGHVAIAESLLNRRADANALTKNEQTPLFNAAAAGHSAMIKVLLAAKAKVDVVDNNGRTALSYAAEKGHLDAVQALLAAKANPNLGQMDLPLASAVKAGHLEVAETLLRGGANANLAAKFSREVRAPDTPFLRGLPEKNGIFGPYLPLQIAVGDRNVSMVKLLLKYKANANALDPWAQPPKSLLFYALQPRDVDLLTALLEAGANPNVVDGEGGYSPLMRVTEPPFKEIAALLVGAGADIKFAGRDGWTALHLAVAYQNKDFTALFLSKGADPNQRMKNGQTPLDIAKANASGPNASSANLAAEIAALLRQHGAVDDLPNLDRIEVRRPEARFAKTVFVKGTNDWNQFTLLEAILNAYSGAQAIPSPGQPYAPLPPPGIQPQLPFPNLHRVVVVRPSRTPGQPPERRVVDLLSPTGEVECAKDVVLEFGDVVEIPEREHTLQESAVELTANEARQMQACRGGKVGLSARGKRTELKVLPYPGSALVGSVLAQAEARSALFSTSDLSRVRVTRVNAVSGQRKEWLLDCSGGNNPDLWLRDGDVIEVPDKP